ncbi:MAG: COX15/CtaA family protein, partial [Thermoanaerobaculia bacterium]
PTQGRELARRLRGPATLLVGLVYVQILLGAVMRHLGAGLAIPDFPLVFGGLVPPRFDPAITIHYAHRLGALAVTLVVVWVAVRAARSSILVRSLAVPVGALVALVSVQVLLGGTVIWTGRAVLPNTLHVGVGAALLATSLVLALTSRRSAVAAVEARAVDVPHGAAAAAS